MRFAALVPLICLFVAGCRTAFPPGGFVTGGAMIWQPTDGDRPSGKFAFVGGGKAIPFGEVNDNPLHGRHGIPHPEEERPNKILWEVFAGYSNDADNQEVVAAGGGIRIKLGYRRRFYGRVGFSYYAFDKEAVGAHGALGYDIYLDDAHRWSLAPEVSAMYLQQSTPTNDDRLPAVTAGLFLTRHFKGKPRKDFLTDVEID